MVKIRIAVLVDSDGMWKAEGFGHTHCSEEEYENEIREVMMEDWCDSNTDHSVVIHWIELEIPIPTKPESCIFLPKVELK